jgi:hypothetical protein
MRNRSLTYVLLIVSSCIAVFLLVKRNENYLKSRQDLLEKTFSFSLRSGSIDNDTIAFFEVNDNLKCLLSLTDQDLKVFSVKYGRNTRSDIFRLIFISLELSKVKSIRDFVQSRFHTIQQIDVKLAFATSFFDSGNSTDDIVSFIVERQLFLSKDEDRNFLRTIYGPEYNNFISRINRAAKKSNHP